MKINKLIIMLTVLVSFAYFDSSIALADSANYNVTVTDHNGENKHYKAENYNAKRRVITLTDGSKIQVPDSSTVTYKSTEKKSINQHLEDAMSSVLAIITFCAFLALIIVSFVID